LLIFLLSKLWVSLSLPLDEPVQVVIIYVGITFITYWVAWLSYHFFEKPFLKLKNQYAVVQSQSSL